MRMLMEKADSQELEYLWTQRCVLRSSLDNLEHFFLQLAVWNRERTLQTPPTFSPGTISKGRGGFNELKTWFYLKINNWEGRDDVFCELLVLSEGPWVTCPALARELWLFAAAPCTLSWEEPLPKVWETSGSENSSKSGKRCGWTLFYSSAFQHCLRGRQCCSTSQKLFPASEFTSSPPWVVFGIDDKCSLASQAAETLWNIFFELLTIFCSKEITWFSSRGAMQWNNSC